MFGRGSALGGGGDGSGTGNGHGGSAVRSNTRARPDGSDPQSGKGLTDQQLQENKDRIQQQLKQQKPHEHENDEEEMEAERDLAEDAQWKRIQQNTFSRWANEHLKTVQLHIHSLETDLSDGLRLIALIEVLAHKRLPKYNKRPTFRSQKLENVSVALKFLENEGIRIVNIDSTDIVDCKLKLILGLIWTLILHYSISMPIMDEDLPTTTTPKERLMGWIQTRMPDLPVKNFTKDWSDGRAVGALVDAVAPGLCPDWELWVPQDGLKNATEAMGLADDWLNVRQLIRPEDMINPKIDEQSMMTYLSQYPNANLKPNAPLRPKTDPSRVRAYGPGIEPTGPIVDAPANFTVETFSAGRGVVDVTVQQPDGTVVPADVRFNNDEKLTFSVSYIPKAEGVYKVCVKFSGRVIPQSPFTVKVEGFSGDASKVTVAGQGVQPDGVVVGRSTGFEIDCKNAGRGTPEVVILDPAGHKTTVPAQLHNLAPGKWRCEYTPLVVGLHSVNVFYAGRAIPQSPFGVRVAPTSDARKVRCGGRGIQSRGVRVGDDGDFQVYTEGAGDGELAVQVTGPGGLKLPVTVSREDAVKYECHYAPLQPGTYTVRVTFGGQEVPKSPFEVLVGPPKQSSICAFGPGLHSGVVGHSSAFVVETNGETGALGFSVAGPSQAEIECKDNGDGSALVRYLPTAPGEYAVHVLCDNEDIPNSPFMAHVLPKTDNFWPERVKVTGAGVQASGVSAGVPAEFVVDTRNAGEAPLEFKVEDVLGRKVPVTVQGSGSDPHLTRVVFTAREAVAHTVEVNFGGVAVAESPFRVNVGAPLNVSKVRVSGPCLEHPVPVNEPTHFSVDVSDAGDGVLEVYLVNKASGAKLACRLIDNGDGTFLAEVLPPQVGEYATQITYGGVAVPKTAAVQVVAIVDVSKIQVDGLEQSVVTSGATEFSVDLSQIGAAVDPRLLSCKIVDPRGNVLPSQVLSDPSASDVLRIMYTPFEAGRHTIELLYDSVPVPGSPFVVLVQAKSDPSRCKAFGPGLASGSTGQPSRFVVETRGAGNGGLSMAIEGPSEAKMTCVDNRDGSCDVEFLPTEPGEYEIIIRFADQHIPGSPFRAIVAESVDASKVRVYGPAVELGVVREGVPAVFNIDVSDAGPGKVAVKLTNSAGKLVDTGRVEDRGNGLYAVHFVPPLSSGGTVLTAQVMFADQEVPCSPFVMQVLAGFVAADVRIVGLDADGRTRVPASLATMFEIDTSRAGEANTCVTIRDPRGQPIKSLLEKVKAGEYAVTFVPHNVGEHVVDVTYGDVPVVGSPFKVDVYPVGDADKCRLVGEVLGEQLFGGRSKIAVDASKAGEGAITCDIVTTVGRESQYVEVIEVEETVYHICYVLEEQGEYDMDIKFGGRNIPNGSFSVKAVAAQAAELVQAERSNGYVQAERQNGSDSQFKPLVLENLPIPGSGGVLIAEVKMPSGKVDKPSIVDNHDGTVRVHYEPREEGTHELYVKYNGEHVQGSPYKFHVDSISSGHVTAYGPGLTHGICGEPVQFTISTKGAGAGGLALAVEGPSKANITYQDNKDCTVGVTYLPTAPGEYKIAVRFGDKHINGSPFYAKITGEGRKRNQISVGACSEVLLPGAITDDDLRTLNASIQTPSGLEEPCFLKRMPSGNIGISFTPREVGDHQVSVKRQSKHITNSPFKVTVGEREVGDAKKVRVSGRGLTEGRTHAENAFAVDTRNAGFGGLSLSIEGPSKAEINCTDKDDGTLSISYKPTEPGYYIVNLKFADHHVEGSPFTVKVTGDGSNRVREKIQRQRDAVPVTEVGSPCKLTFKMPGITSFDLSATVTSPSGSTDDAEIQEVKDGLYAVNFVPKELGAHTVSVKYTEMHIPGSPFQFTVGPLHDSGAHLVKAGGCGLERGEVGQPADFNVWTREAGGGALAISIEGPSKAEIVFKDRMDGSCDVAYTVSEPGEYRIGLKFNDRHIPDSPHKVYISPAMGDAHLLEVAQFPSGAVQADTPAQFLVRMNGAKGQLDAKVIAPSNAEDDCFIQAIDSEESSVRFYPRESGIHNIHVKFNGVHIAGSPFRIKVGKDVADAASVRALGDGLHDAQTGVKEDFVINTCNAGAGKLTLTMDGPAKVSMDCSEVEEGYKVRYTALLAGEYFMSIKYNNTHIVGSPFKITCTGRDLVDAGSQETSSLDVETVAKYSKGGPRTAPVMPNFKSDATKVTSKGMGLKKAFLGKQNQFTINASEAGTGVLFVALYHPRGPGEEVQTKHTGRNTFAVNYYVRERSDYMLMVLWNENHIPGSPFNVEVSLK